MEKTRHLRIHVQEVADKLIQLDSFLPSEQDARVPAWFAWAVPPEPIVGENRAERFDVKPYRIMVEAHPGDEISDAWKSAREFSLRHSKKRWAR